MRGGLFRKLILLYLFLVSVLFLFVNLFGSKYIENKLITREEQLIYKQAGAIAQQFVEPYYSNKMTVGTLVESLKAIGDANDVRILIVASWGRVIGDTAPIREGAVNIDKSVFDTTVHRSLFLPNITESAVIAVVQPIIYNYETRGYVLVLKDLTQISEDVQDDVMDLNIYYLIAITTLAIGMAVIYLLFVIPTKKLIKITSAYSEGNFDIKTKIYSNDEYLELYNRIGYMGETMSRFDEYQRKIISNISHDFRSPLTSIKGYLEAMKDGTISVDEQPKYLDVVLFEVERLTKLTTNLLTLNTFDQTGIILQKAKFDIISVIKSVAQSFEGTCKKKHIVIQLILTESEINVFADRGRIEQVIYNLVDNAIKFSHSESEIRIFAEEKGKKAMISIQDEGSGIEKRNLNKIWDRFYKTDSSRGKDKKGTGLGLSIVKEIMVAHGENINVISTQGVGTEFIFTLPIVSG